MSRAYRDKGGTPNLGVQSVRLLKMPGMYSAGQLMACFQYQMTSGCPVCFWHEYQVGNDAGGEG